MSARTLARGSVYILTVVAGTAIALTPSLLLFPQAASDDLRIAFVFLIAFGLLWGSWGRPAARREILVWVSLCAATTVATFVILEMTPSKAQFKIPTPNVLPRLLHVDGELADDTFLYELVNEIWLSLAVVAVAATLMLRRKKKASMGP